MAYLYKEYFIIISKALQSPSDAVKKSISLTLELIELMYNRSLDCFFIGTEFRRLSMP
jgi:hypothetical protein